MVCSIASGVGDDGISSGVGDDGISSGDGVNGSSISNSIGAKGDDCSKTSTCGVM